MKKQKLLILASVITLSIQIFAQSTSNNNNFLPLGKFLGWNNTNGTNVLPFLTNNVQRLQINGTNNLNLGTFPTANNAGYIGAGLNNNSPLFHLDVLTPALPNWGEYHLGVGPSDVPNSKAGFLNAALGNNQYVPTMFGSLDATQAFPAITTLGNIANAQDVAGSRSAVFCV